MQGTIYRKEMDKYSLKQESISSIVYFLEETKEEDIVKRRLDIYGTLGPSCQEKEVLKKMFCEGMTGIRLNLSHTTLRDAASLIQTFHQAAGESGISPELLIDLQGPELRIGLLAKPFKLDEGKSVILSACREAGQNMPAAMLIPVPEILLPHLSAGKKLLLDDGKILLEVSQPGEEFVQARVVRGGILTSRKSIAMEDCDLPVPTLTRQDIENLKDAAYFGVTGVMQPFVRNRRDLEIVRRTMDENGCEKIRLFAKIENQRGIDNMEDFFAVADEIVIARGDLGNAMPLWELPGVQKRLSAKCKKAGKPFMVVTQMLASMEHKAVPTRAEVSDIYNAVLDGASSVMVTGETAAGEYPVEVIRYLSRTASQALQECDS